MVFAGCLNYQRNKFVQKGGLVTGALDKIPEQVEDKISGRLTLNDKYLRKDIVASAPDPNSTFSEGRKDNDADDEKDEPDDNLIDRDPDNYMVGVSGIDENLIGQDEYLTDEKKNIFIEDMSIVGGQQSNYSHNGGVNQMDINAFSATLTDITEVIYPTIPIILLEIMCCYHDLLDCKLTSDPKVQKHLSIIRNEFNTFKNEVVKIFRMTSGLLKSYPTNLDTYLTYLQVLLEFHKYTSIAYTNFIIKVYKQLEENNIPYYTVLAKNYKFTKNIQTPARLQLSNESDQTNANAAISMLKDFANHKKISVNRFSYCTTTTSSNCYIEINNLFKRAYSQKVNFETLVGDMNRLKFEVNQNKIKTILDLFATLKSNIDIHDANISKIKALAFNYSPRKGIITQITSKLAEKKSQLSRKVNPNAQSNTLSSENSSQTLSKSTIKQLTKQCK